MQVLMFSSCNAECSHCDLDSFSPITSDYLDARICIAKHWQKKDKRSAQAHNNHDWLSNSSLSFFVILLSHFFRTGKMYPGSVTFKQKWKDLRAMPGSSQYDMMVKNIQNSVCSSFSCLSTLSSA